MDDRTQCGRVPWRCWQCGQTLGWVDESGACLVQVEQVAGREPLVQMGPDGATAVQCPVCGVWRKWNPANELQSAP